MDSLPPDWHTRIEVTRDLGTDWLQKNETVLLKVPSVIAPETFNLPFNPSHNQANRFRITRTFSYRFDMRIEA
jgi:RES domain-containing protein